MRFATQIQADSFFIRKAQSVRKLTDDPKAITSPNSGVGAVIVIQNMDIISSPNIYFDKKLTKISISDSDRYFFIEHAERAAIYLASRKNINITGATIYCTRFPCADCARAIVLSGILRVVVPKDMDFSGRWLEHQTKAMEIFQMSNVELTLF